MAHQMEHPIIGTDGAGINAAPTPGYPTHLVEWHTLLSLGFQAHLVSFITEGVFERYPRFTVVLVEGGVAWLAPLIWRLTDHWRSMRSAGYEPHPSGIDPGEERFTCRRALRPEHLMGDIGIENRAH